MSIPSVNQFSNQPGGGMVTAMGGINSLANEMILRKINQIKAQYMPITSLAEAASRLAYSNLIGPQYTAKLLGNEGVVANMGDANAKAALQKVLQAGIGNQIGQSLPMNSLAQIQQGNMGTMARHNNSLSNFFADKLKGVFGGQLQQPQGMPSAGAMENMVPSQMSAPEMPPFSGKPPKGGIMLEGQQWYDKNGNPVYEEEEGINDSQPMQLELTKGRQQEPSWEENLGRFRGVAKQGEESGKLRAQSIGDVGEEMKQLSTTGANVDRLIDDFTNPDFMAMREEFPFLQDTQLKVAAKTGSPQQRNMIGNLIADIESFKGSTVNSFKGQTLKREFDYADKLKPTENDTVYTALGKLQTLKALKDIAWQKDIKIKDYMQNGRMSLADAVQRADKEIDIKSIDKSVKEYTQPLHKLRNKKTGQTIFVPKKRMELLLTKGAK